MVKKMTNKEIDVFHDLIYCKSMNKVCGKKYCSYGKHKDNCIGELMQDTVDLIYRQQEEIEKLKRQKNIVDKFISEAWRRIDELDKLNETTRAEAIKEFSDRIISYIDVGHLCSPTMLRWSDLSVKEMVEHLANKMIGDADNG